MRKWPTLVKVDFPKLLRIEGVLLSANFAVCATKPPGARPRFRRKEDDFKFLITHNWSYRRLFSHKSLKHVYVTAAQ
jgi:hypothetical protein